MKWIAIGAIFFSLAGFVHAAGSDEQYLDIYNEILQADSLNDGGHPDTAASHYLKAQGDLQKLQADHPYWNPDVVKYRLDYLAEKLQGLKKFLPRSNSAPPNAVAESAPVTNSALADAQATIAALKQQNAGFQQQLRALNDANSELQGKLKEALTIQPAAVSPGEVARDEARIVSLEKERDLLSVALAQEKASHSASMPAASAVENADKKISELKARFAAELRRSKLELAAAQGQAAAAERKFVAAGKQLQELKASTEADKKQMQEELAQLRAAKAESDKVIADANKELQELRAAHGPEIHAAGETKPSSEAHDQLKQLVAEVEKDEAEISRLKDMVAESDKKLVAANDELKSVNDARKAAAHEMDSAKALAEERDKLKAELADRSKLLADVEAHHRRELFSLRAELQQAQDRQQELIKNLEVQSQPAAAPVENPVSALQLERLQARVAVLEADPIPYTKEELALLVKSPAPSRQMPSADGPVPAADPPATNAASTKSASAPSKPRHVYTVSDLPPGSGAIWAAAMRSSMDGNYAEAEKKFKEVLRQDEDNVYVLAHLGNAQFALNELAACEKTIKHALELDPEDPGSLFLMGLLRYRQNRLDEALDALSLSAKCNPTNTATQNFLGCVLADKGLRRAAETAFRKALLCDPNYGDAHFNLALVYAGSKPPSLELARWHYKRALALGHDKSDKMEQLLNDSPQAVSVK